MKILTLSNCPLVRSQGSGYVITHFCDQLRQCGHEVDLFGPENFEPLPTLKGRAYSYRIALGMWFFVRRQLRKKPYDLIEFYGAESWLAAWWFSRVGSNKRKFLMVSHSNGLETCASEVQRKYLQTTSPDGTRPRWYHINQDELFRRAFTSVDCIVTVSECDAEYAQQRKYQPENSILAIENSLSETFLGLTNETIRPMIVGFCGSWLARKGVEVLRNDLNAILKEFAETQLYLIGVGKEFDVAAHFDSDVCSRIQVFHFVESKDELRRLYQQISILVVPSIYEGFGLVTAEAMACGCAIVATKTGFAASLQHGKEAMLMEQPASPLLYDAVKQLLQDDDLRSHIAESGYKRVQTLRWDNAAARLEMQYLRWLETFRNDRIPTELSAQI